MVAMAAKTAISVLEGSRHRKEDKKETQTEYEQIISRKGESPDTALRGKSDHAIIFDMVPTKNSVDIFGFEFWKKMSCQNTESMERARWNNT